MCHLASWVIDKQVNEAHGQIFKKWWESTHYVGFLSILTIIDRGSRVMKAFPDVEVTVGHLACSTQGMSTDEHKKTLHTYEISYKYEWSTCASLVSIEAAALTSNRMCQLL